MVSYFGRPSNKKFKANYMKFSYQLYSSRATVDWAQTLAHLASSGYSYVEGFGGAYSNDPKAFRRVLDNYDLSMPTAHVGIDEIEQDTESVVEIAKTLGIKQIFGPNLMPELRPTNADDWQMFGRRLEKIREKLNRAEIEFGWHNHDFEFQILDDGSFPIQHILGEASSVLWEVDVAWIIRAGQDPKPWIDRFSEQIRAVHIKDLALKGTCLNEDGWADVGEGIVSWQDLLGFIKKKTMAETFVVEHDKPSDMKRFAERSIQNLRDMGY